MNCKNHPDTLAGYHCTKCEGYFCASCLTIMRVNEDFTAYICKECEGKAEPIVDKKSFSKAAKAPAQKTREAKIKEGKTLREKKPRLTLEGNFWIDLLDSLVFPLKGRGVLVVLLTSALFWGLSVLKGMTTLPVSLLTGFFTILWFMYLFKTVEDVCHGAERLQSFPDAAYWETLIQPIFALLLASILYLLPAHIYFLWRPHFDFAYFSLLFVGFFLFPMALGQIIARRKIGAVNPVNVVKSIGKMFLAYVALIFVLLALFILVLFVNSEYFFRYESLRDILLWILVVYASFVSVYLLGAFARSARVKIAPVIIKEVLT